ncbi:MAG: hypothetical protein RLZZ32_688 [Cyanobacteriota bacterium]|jgi:hypothetical protein
MRSTASALAAAALTFWALVALADRPQPTPLPTAQTLPTTTATPDSWRLPDPRTITRFPGP